MNIARQVKSSLRKYINTRDISSLQDLEEIENLENLDLKLHFSKEDLEQLRYQFERNPLTYSQFLEIGKKIANIYNIICTQLVEYDIEQPDIEDSIIELFSAAKSPDNRDKVNALKIINATNKLSLKDLDSEHPFSAIGDFSLVNIAILNEQYKLALELLQTDLEYTEIDFKKSYEILIMQLLNNIWTADQDSTLDWRVFINEILEIDIIADKLGTAKDLPKIMHDVFDEYLNEINLTVLASQIPERILKDVEFNPNHSFGYNSLILQLAAIFQETSLFVEIVNAQPELLHNEYNLLTILSSNTDIELLFATVETIEDTSTLLKNICPVISIVQCLIAHGDYSQNPEHQAIVKKLGDLLIEKDQSHTYDIVKKEGNISKEFFDDGKIHIAIARDEGNWSLSGESFIRYVEKNYSDIVCHIVGYQDWNNMTTDVKKCFSGFIVPGANDKYPKEKKISLDDFTEDNYLAMTKLELEMMQFAAEHYIPTIGICAGAQALALSSGGGLDFHYPDSCPDEKSKIDIKYGSMEYFMSLSPEYQQAIMSSKTLSYPPELSFHGVTSYHFCASLDNMGDGVHLGGHTFDAKTNEMIPMVYSKGPIFVTQYHPEYQFFNSVEKHLLPSQDDDPQVNWLMSFLKLAEIYHDHFEDDSNPSVEEYLTSVQDHLAELFDAEQTIYDELPAAA